MRLATMIPQQFGAPIMATVDGWVRVHPRWVMTSDSKGQPYWLHLEDMKGTWDMPEEVAEQLMAQQRMQQQMAEQMKIQQQMQSQMTAASSSNLGGPDERAALPKLPARPDLLAGLRWAFCTNLGASRDALLVAIAWVGIGISLVMSLFPLFIGFTHDCWFAVLVRFSNTVIALVTCQLLNLRDLLYRRALRYDVGINLQNLLRWRESYRRSVPTVYAVLIVVTIVIGGLAARAPVLDSATSAGGEAEAAAFAEAVAGDAGGDSEAAAQADAMFTRAIAQANHQCSRLCCGRHGEHVPDVWLRTAALALVVACPAVYHVLFKLWYDAAEDDMLAERMALRAAAAQQQQQAGHSHGGPGHGHGGAGHVHGAG